MKNISKKLRVGIVGAGGIFQWAHAESWISTQITIREGETNDDSEIS